jgi:hypothetical protein
MTVSAVTESDRTLSERALRFEHRRVQQTDGRDPASGDDHVNAENV